MMTRARFTYLSAIAALLCVFVGNVKSDAVTGGKNPLLVLSETETYSVMRSVHMKCADWILDKEKPQHASYIETCKHRLERLRYALKEKYDIEFDDLDLYEKSFSDHYKTASKNYKSCIRSTNGDNSRRKACLNKYPTKFIF